MPKSRAQVLASLLFAFTLLLVFLDEIHHAIRAPVAVIAMSNEVSTPTLRMDSATSANSASVDEARRLVDALETQSGDAERRSNRWAFFGVVLTVLAALAGYAAYRQAINENKINERLRKADQALADLLMEKQQTATEIARNEAAQALSGLGQANLEIEARKKENLAVERQLEAERTARLELEQSLAPRAIPSDVAMKLVERLRGIDGPKEMKIFWVMGDSESGYLGEQFKRLFESAGWKVEAQGAMLTSLVRGHCLIADPSRNPPANVAQVRDAFNLDRLFTTDLILEKGGEASLVKPVALMVFAKPDRPLDPNHSVFDPITNQIPVGMTEAAAELLKAVE